MIRRKAFTLIETLIVIVIIGLLSRALIPRLTSARARTNDVARKADLRQIATALTMYQMDYGNFPNSVSFNEEASALLPLLTKVGMAKIPLDPAKKDVMGYFASPNTNGTYMYLSLWKGGVYNKSFALVSVAETEGGANRINPDQADRFIFTDGSPCTSNYYCDLADIATHLCTKIVKADALYNGGTGYCTYTNPEDLQYVYLSP